MCDSRKKLQDPSDMRLQNLCQVIYLLKSSYFASPFHKHNRALVAISNSFPSNGWCCMPSVKLILDASRVSTLPSFPSYFLFACPPSY
jgi:hypothetical protein